MHRLRSALTFLVLGLFASLSACGSEDATLAESQPQADAEPDDSQAPADSGVDSAPQAEASTDSAPQPDATAEDDAQPGEDAPADSPQEAQPDSQGPETCPPPPACDAPYPDLGQPRGFRHTLSEITAAVGSPRHRGRDLYLRAGEEQWVLGKFAYGTFDKDIVDEDIDVYLLRDCAGDWTPLGTYRTTDDSEHESEYGVEDSGGRIFVDLASAGQSPLGIGRHKVLMVVGGDLTYTEQFIDVLGPQDQIVVTDVDGTLTSSEYAAVTDILGLSPAEAHPAASDVMQAFASRGYHIFYLTARAEWMTQYSRDWLQENNFPPGVVHTTFSGLGATGSGASLYKKNELADLAVRTGVVPSYAFGNKSTDVDAFHVSGIDGQHCYYFDLSGELYGGTSISDYATVLPVAQSAPLACQ